MASTEGGIFKHLFFSVIGCVGGMLIMAFTIGHNVVTRDDMPALITQYSPYTEDQKNIQQQLVDQKEEIGEMKQELAQQSVDIARISAKLGVPAHPEANP